MDKSGTTATFLYLTEEAVIVANVGDSRAILSVGASYEEDHASAIQLTVDHVASDKNEKKIIEQNGGYIERNGGIERVNGVMAVSRSIGDIPLASILSRQPHIVAMTRDEINARCEYVEKTSFAYNTSVRDSKMPCFIVLASDGLWDVMNNQEVIDMVQLVLRRHDDDSGISWEDGGAFQEAAQMLTEEAYIRGSSDNIGVCVVALA
uniref:PPM-type phosphatase domain-containing protein n=1 Tax=Proboscia inermis TaxID=420281 RepID=A0A7S0CEJ4_9STRA|mmetsp:Transcript_43906/g.44395  ORF Transcript_43906/g.44395 Transcript_43906/m.44395 type:complete len:207 (+) Transcript_43906:632-1252(+)